MKVRLKGGDLITHQGKSFKVSKKCSINAVPVGIGKQEEKEQESIETSQEAVKGHQKSDIPDPIDRTKAVELLKEYLSKIEEHQSELLRHQAFRDDELDDSQQVVGEHYKASIYATSVVYISELESLVENLGKL